METALSIVAIVALVSLSVFLVYAIRTLRNVDALVGESHLLFIETKKNIAQISSDITLVREHLIPVLDDVAIVTRNVAMISDGLQSRADDVYDAVDDALNVVRGAIDDVERIKDTVVATINGPLTAAKGISTGVFSTIFKGIGLIRDIIEGLKKKK